MYIPKAFFMLSQRGESFLQTAHILVPTITVMSISNIILNIIFFSRQQSIDMDNNNFIENMDENKTGQQMMVMELSQNLSKIESELRVEQRKEEESSKMQAVLRQKQNISKQSSSNHFIPPNLAQESQKPKQQIRSKQKQCKKHNCKALYSCADEQFCNVCLTEDNLPINAKIKCLCSMTQILYKVQSNQKSQQKQLKEQSVSKQQKEEKNKQYFCQKCIDKTSKYKHLCSIHCRTIDTICLNTSCILENSYLFCNRCDCSNHSDHKLIQFRKQLFQQYFKVSCQRNINQFEEQLTKIKSKLRFNQMQKLHKIKLEYQLQQSLLIDSIPKYQQKQVDKMINNFFDKRQFQDLFLLTKISALNEKISSDYQLKMQLEFINDGIQKIHTYIYQQIQNLFLHSSIKIKKLFEKSMQQIEAYIGQKYQTLYQKQIEGQYKIFPILIDETHQKTLSSYQGLVENIEIDKLNAEAETEKIEKDIKNQRHIFFNQNELVSPKNIFQLSSQVRLQIQSNERSFLKTLQNEDIGESLKEQVIEQLNNISEQQRKRKRVCQPFRSLLQYDFKQLKCLRIIYKQHQYLRDELISIPAIEIFRFINQHQNLQSIIVRGVQIQDFIIFLRLFKLAHMSFQEAQKQDSYLLQKYKDQIPWIRKMKKSAKMSLSGQVTIMSSNFSAAIKLLIVFFKKIGHINNLKIILDLKKVLIREGEKDLLQQLFNALSSMQQLRIQLSNYHFYVQQQRDPSKQTRDQFVLFTELSKLKNVSQIQLNSTSQLIKDILFDCQDIDEYLAKSLSQPISILFNDCQLNFIPEFINVKSMICHNTCVKDKENQFIKAIASSNKLQRLKLSSMRNELAKDQKNQISFSLLTNLQYLQLSIVCSQVGYCQWLDSKVLSTIPTLSCQNLKHFTIEFQQITEIDLKPIFKQLASISFLSLLKVKFDEDTLELIPSKIQTLMLDKCEVATRRLLTKIDRKWDELKELIIKQDKSFQSENIIQECYFKALTQIKISQVLLGGKKQKLWESERLGIKIVIIK